ncbi:MAG TPA: SDR family oxidoreductase [Bacteroidales bacterium]|nr:SDR family oxidoreductase [Bacteroidales bacterium]
MNILITGASRGIGYELAQRFAEEENTHVICISRNHAKLEELANKPTGNNSRVTPLVYDIIDVMKEPGALKRQILGLVSPLDIIINNAGYLINKPFMDFTYQEAIDIFNTNFFAAAFLIQQLKDLMIESDARHIVNISSMGGFQGSSKFAGLSFYSAAKAAIANLTECLAEEFKKEGIRVNALALGAVDTEMLHEAFPGFQPPLKAKEMAEYVFDFARNGQHYFNGKILPVSTGTP